MSKGRESAELAFWAMQAVNKSARAKVMRILQIHSFDLVKDENKSTH